MTVPASKVLRNTERPRPLPPNAGKGRRKGIPNKMTADSRRAMALAFQGLNGVEGLIEWGRANRSEFYRLWGKTIPQDHAGDIVTELRVVVVRDANASVHGDGPR